MTPQEYVDRERRHVRINIGRAERSGNGAVIQQLEERLRILDEFERRLKALYRKKEVCRLMRAAAEVLIEDEKHLCEGATTKIVAEVDGKTYTLSDIIFGLTLAAAVWEQEKER